MLALNRPKMRTNFDERKSSISYVKIRNNFPDKIIVLSNLKKLVKVTFWWLFTLNFCFILCQRSTEPLFNQEISLTVESVEVTEVWLRLKIEPFDRRMTYVVQRDKDIVFSGKISKDDTLLHDENLKPAENYVYSAYRQLHGQKLLPAATLEATTLDTTSHDFEFQTHIVGDDPVQTRILDIFVLDSENIWIVGEIHTKDTNKYDSTGKWIDPYNAARWNGHKWEYHHVYLKFYQDRIIWSILTTLFSFSPQDLWVHALYGMYGHWNGSDWSGKYIEEHKGEIKKIWGTDSTNLYFVGRNGNVTHFDGKTWQLQETNTNVDLRDVYGYRDISNETETVYSCGFNFWTGEGIILIKKADGWQIFDNGIDGIISSHSWHAFSSVWTNQPHAFYVTSFSEVYKAMRIGEEEYICIKIFTAPRGIYRIRGNNSNDIFICGESVGTFCHFNGSTWKPYPQFSEMMQSMDFKMNIVAAVMGNNTVIIGKRTR